MTTITTAPIARLQPRTPKPNGARVWPSINPWPHCWQEVAPFGISAPQMFRRSSGAAWTNWKDFGKPPYFRSV